MEAHRVQIEDAAHTPERQALAMRVTVIVSAFVHECTPAPGDWCALRRLERREGDDRRHATSAAQIGQYGGGGR
jgi:hypothetical protein